MTMSLCHFLSLRLELDTKRAQFHDFPRLFPTSGSPGHMNAKFMILFTRSLLDPMKCSQRLPAI